MEGSLRLKYQILFSSGAWHLAASMASILVPLYAYSLGYSNVSIGALISLPMLLHIVVRLLAGALADRWSEKAVLVICFALIALAGPLFLVADTLVLLFVAQVCLILSRAFFYSSAQSYVSRAPTPEPMGKRLGGLAVAISVGDVLGVILAGLLVVAAGFAVSFLALTAFGVIALVSGLLLPTLPAREGKRTVVQILGAMADVGRKRQMIVVLVTAFGAAIPVALSGSFFPLFITYLGHSEDLVGVVIAVRSVGSILTGWLLAHAIGVATQRQFLRLGYLALGITLFLLPLSGELVLIALLIGLSGVASTILDITSQTMVTRISDEANRASAFALAGLGWSVCVLVVPLTFGALVDGWSYDVAFFVYGLVLAIVAGFAAYLYDWLMPAARPSTDARTVARSSSTHEHVGP